MTRKQAATDGGRTQNHLAAIYTEGWGSDEITTTLREKDKSGFGGRKVRVSDSRVPD